MKRLTKINTTNEKDARRFSGSAFYNQYKRFSFFGTLSVRLAYQFNKRLAVTFTPTYYRMLSNILVVPENFLAKASQRHHALTGNIGVLFML